MIDGQRIELTQNEAENLRDRIERAIGANEPIVAGHEDDTLPLFLKFDHGISQSGDVDGICLQELFFSD